MSASARPSGKFVVRIDPSMHRRMAVVARKKGISLNNACAEAFRDYLTVPGSATEPSNRDALAKQVQEAGIPLLGIVLFGSTSRGEANESSDVDLLLVLPGGVPLSRNLYTVWDTLLLPSKLSPQFVCLPEDIAQAGALWCECALDGVVLWETNNSVTALLQRLRHAVAEGRLIRKVTHGHGYWVRHAE
jgi:hypothetical protein